MRGQHILAPQIRRLDLCSADLTTRAALPQRRIEMQIGSHAKFETANRIRFHQIMLHYKHYSELNMYSHKHKQNYKLVVVYEAGIMVRLASITQALCNY